MCASVFLVVNEEENTNPSLVCLWKKNCWRVDSIAGAITSQSDSVTGCFVQVLLFDEMKLTLGMESASNSWVAEQETVI